jgi:hypothetical protein
MPIPSGDWKGNFNGVEAPIRFNAPNAAGQITGTFSSFEFRGFWDEVGQTVAFPVTVTFEGTVPVVALFRGYLFRTSQQAEPGRDVLVSLAGHFELTPTSAAALPFAATGTARRNVFGWFAQFVEVN